MIEGTDLALTAAGTEVKAAKYSGKCVQHWRIEQCTDGAYRIMPARTACGAEPNKIICLYSAGDSTPSLAPWDFNSDNCKWNFRNF